MLFNIFLFVLFAQIELRICNQTSKGALISVSLQSQVGFNLDEIPKFAYENAKNYCLYNVTENEWIQNALLQISFSNYGLAFPMPSKNLNVNFTSKPFETVIQGHSYVARNFTLKTVLIGAENSLNSSGPISSINGALKKNIIVPVDAQHFFQRTGYACAMEGGFRYNTVNSRNIKYFFNTNCGVEPFVDKSNITFDLAQELCHLTSFPNVSCMESLKENVGYFNLTICWKRLNFNEKLAEKYRFGNNTSETPDLIPLQSFIDANVAYIYFDENSCAFKNQCIRKKGWRKLYRYTFSSLNAGKQSMSYGNVLPNSDFINKGVYVYDQCDLVYNFQYYGGVNFNNISGTLDGYCISNSRYFNNEFTDFTYSGTCFNMRIISGWYDNYIQGTDCQWLDITDIKPGKYNLTNEANPDDIICEGTSLFDANNNKIWIQTDLKNSNGQIVYQEACNHTKNYKQNNYVQSEISINGVESGTTSPCQESASLSPKKDCGFKLKYDNLSCSPNQTTIIYLGNRDQIDAVVRICESSYVLGHSVLCDYYSSLNNVIIQKDSDFNEVSFICPTARSDNEKGGLYSILVSNLIPTDSIPDIIIDESKK